MANYKIFFRASVWKDLAPIPKRDTRKILAKIYELSDNPRPAGCKKLSVREFYRIRQGRYRVVYSIQDDELTIWIVKVGDRKNIYK